MQNNESLPEFLGRVTVYSTIGCPHCKKAKFSLKELSIPFVEINLDKNPERRAEMIETTKKTSVPQIFFNEIYIGGNDDLQKVFRFLFFQLILLISFLQWSEKKKIH